MTSIHQHALQRLESLIDYERRPPVGGVTKHFHLKAFREFLDRLGAPDHDLKVIHIAGTRGKGSAATLLAEALCQRGQRVGLFRSPHVDSIRERITVDGKWITREAFTRLVNTTLDAMGSGAKPEATFRTHFETLVAMALLHFQKRCCDWVILETGLGGRLDATNVVSPHLTIITALGFDHTRILGETIEKIAGEKAGIIKPGVTCVIGPQPRGLGLSAMGVIRERAMAMNAPLLFAGRRWPCEVTSHRLSGLTLDSHDHRISIPRPGLSSAPAVATVLTALEALGFEIPRRLKFEWPFTGRAEVISKHPPTLLDGAHDPLALANLRATLAEVAPGPRRLCLVMMEDKNHRKALSTLKLTPEDRVALPAFAMPRAMPPESLRACLAEIAPMTETKCFATQCSALSWLWGSRPRGTICVTGSFYHLHGARRSLRRLAGGSV